MLVIKFRFFFDQHDKLKLILGLATGKTHMGFQIVKGFLFLASSPWASIFYNPIDNNTIQKDPK